MKLKVGDIVSIPGDGLFLLLELKEKHLLWSCLSFKDNTKRLVFFLKDDILIARLNP